MTTFNAAKYAKLVAKREEREERLRELRKSFKQIEQEVAAGYGANLDAEIEAERELAGNLANLDTPYETELVRIEWYIVPTWEVKDARLLAKSLQDMGRAEYIKYAFDKAPLNKFLEGCRLAEFGVPAGVDYVQTPTLRIKVKDA